MMKTNISHRSPYIGLVPYSEEDAPFFFGRETECSMVTANLLSSKLTLLYGAVGAGKSSLLLAGVAFSLGQFSRQNMLTTGSPEFIAVVFREWHGDPLFALFERIRLSVREVLDGQATGGIQTPTSLVETIKVWSEIANCRLLVILDQFEEYFLYHSQDRGRESFYSEFSRAVNHPDLNVNFLISLREDALSKLDIFSKRIPNLFNNYLRVGHLSLAGAREAIKKPLEVYNNLTGAEPAYAIEDELVEEVCWQVRAERRDLILDFRRGLPEDESDTKHVETFYLQLVMDKLWEYELMRGSHRLHLATLRKFGGAANIIQDHVGVNLAGFPDEEQEAAASIFRYLITPSGAKIAYTASDLAEVTELSKKRVEAVLEKLCAGDTRILRSFYTGKSGSNVKSYEIYHDVLANAILDWRAWYLRDQARMRAEREAKAQQESERERLRQEEEERRRQEELRQRRAKRRMRQLTVVLVLSALITIGFFILYLFAARQQRKAEAAAREADAQRAESQKVLAVVGELDRSVAYFKAVMRGHADAVLGVDFSPDRARIVTASNDGTARLWETETGNLVKELKGHTAVVRSALFSPDGRLIATASNDGTARLWEADSGRELTTLQGHTKEVRTARFNPDGTRLVTASDDGTARVWDTATGHEVVAALRAHSGVVTYAAFSGDSASVVTAGTDGTARVWNLATGNHLLLEGHENEVNMAAFSPDGELVVTASADWTARIWRVSDGRSYILRGHTGPVNGVAFSADGTLIVTASDDKTARVWDVKTGRLLTELRGHTEAVLGAVFSDDTARVITASADKTTRVWETSSGRVLFELRGHTDTINQAAFSPVGGKLAATASLDRTARIWDISGEGGIRIRNVIVNASPDSYSGPCPVRVRISASITASGSGTIEYRFVRSDGYAGQERTLSFENSGTKEVSTTWLFGSRAYPNSSGSVQLEVASPQNFRSSEAAVYNIRCALPYPTPAPTPVFSLPGPGGAPE